MATDPKATEFRAPKGTYDVLPPESWQWQALVRLALDTFAAAGYAPIETPVFEHTEVFERGVGEASEVVNKQMYTFTDLGGRSLTLRPEGTAPVVRAVIEHGLERRALPLKLAYAEAMFRQERPQKGRYRQFFQVGIEGIGSDSPLLDAEVIEVGKRYLEEAGVETTLLLNSIGHVDPSCRQGYLKVLVEFLIENEDRLAPADRERVRSNPLRTFDSKEEMTARVMEHAPKITDHLCGDCRAHFESVQEVLGAVGIAFRLEPRLVRGLDYYTRTAFEFVADGLGAQNAVGGGGRYDGLAEALGGRALPGIGFALGVDRIVLASTRQASEEVRAPRAFVVAEEASEAFKVATELRRGGISAEFDLRGRSFRKQVDQAVQSGAAWMVIAGSRELQPGRVSVKNLATRVQEEISRDDLLTKLQP